MPPVTKKLKRGNPPPVKTTVRRSQLITTFGVGSVIPVESESFMIAGLDLWNTKESDRIHEPRLSRSLGATSLFAPPGAAGMVPMVRFPEWVHCPKCSRLDRFWRVADKDGKGEYINKCRHCITARLVPSRFVACCINGHIEDFPYDSWVHRGAVRESAEKHSLSLRTDSRNSTLAGVTVTCTCGVSRTLEGALGRGSLTKRCSGSSPWLGRDDDACSESLVGLQRGASNVWFADVRSALTLDHAVSPAEELLERSRSTLEKLAGTDLDAVLEILARTNGVDLDELKEIVRRQSEEEPNGREAFLQLRRDEYSALGREHAEEDGFETFVCEPHIVESATDAGHILGIVSKVSKLREVRALQGFSRVAVSTGESKAPRAKLSTERVGWLPAIEVLGEGIFLRLDEKAIAQWEQSAFARSRVSLLNQSLQVAAPEWVENVQPVSPRELLIHSLSHAVLNELAIDTGYPASSIRERLYTEPGQAGILLYTATADSAGSLGGLCARGTVENMLAVIEAATERSQWCAADPVCLESLATGAGARNLAACHSCLLVPEVSCELMNGYLDRATLVGTATDPSGGFLTNRFV
ncbi:DrmB family protein [Nocardia sp. NPDC058705]|uniref:DrmB family protein n=1 Tax=Nocardia sp. NPDC058705 TaxID=3346609 RepID=UPI00367BD472